MSGHALDELPEHTVSVLATVDEDGAPHAIPVSTARRAGAKWVVFALGPSRSSHDRVRADSRAALLVMAADAAHAALERLR